MKYAIILPDGAADEPVPALDGRTPLEAALTPHMDWIARHGQLGRAITVPEGYIAGTDVATLSVMGYDPAQYYTGRAPLEAAAKGLTVAADEIIFRCNFITVIDGRMHDFTADHIDQYEADQLIDDLNHLFAADPCVFHAGVSYRNLMVAGGAEDLKLTTQAPHDIPNQAVADYLPKGSGHDRIIDLMTRAAGMLNDHPVNVARRKKGREPVTNIWLWGQGRPTNLEPFADRFGPNGAAITGVDIIRGITRTMGFQLIEVPGATGYLDTNYAGKGQAGVKALNEFDLVIVHIEAPDEAGHEGNAADKVKAIERVDELIVGPMLDAVRQFDSWRIFVAPDHPTPVRTKAHSAEPPPFCYAGSDIQPMPQPGTFGESAAQRSGLLIDPGHTLMPRFIG